MIGYSSHTEIYVETVMALGTKGFDKKEFI